LLDDAGAGADEAVGAAPLRRARPPDASLEIAKLRGKYEVTKTNDFHQTVGSGALSIDEPFERFLVETVTPSD